MKVLGCVVQYGIGACIAMVLGAILGSSSLFQDATLGNSSITMAQVVQFVAYSVALLMLWLMGYQMSQRMPKSGRLSLTLRPIMIPVMTFVVVLLAYGVIPLLADPIMTPKGWQVYDWMFIAGMIGAALWVTIAWFTESGAVFEGKRRAS